MSTALLPVTLSMLCAGMAGGFLLPPPPGAGGFLLDKLFLGK